MDCYAAEPVEESTLQLPLSTYTEPISFASHFPSYTPGLPVASLHTGQIHSTKLNLRSRQREIIILHGERFAEKSLFRSQRLLSIVF